MDAWNHKTSYMPHCYLYPINNYKSDSFIAMIRPDIWLTTTSLESEIHLIFGQRIPRGGGNIF